MKTILSTFILLLINAISFSRGPGHEAIQEQFLNLKIHAHTNDTSEIPIALVDVELSLNDSVIQWLQTDSLGNALVENITYGYKYLLKISKKGYIPKLAIFNLTHNGNVKISTKEQPIFLKMEKSLPHEDFSRLDSIPIIEFYIHPTQGYLDWKYLNNKWLNNAKLLCQEGLSFSNAFNYISLLESAYQKALNEDYVGAVMDLEKSLEIIDSDAVKEEIVKLLELARFKYMKDHTKH